MYSGKGKVKYHKICFKKQIVIVLLEVKPNYFFWLSFYINKKLRNKIISKELIEYLLFNLKGWHEIHWHFELSTFNELAKLYKWKTKESDIFESCYSSTIKSFKKSTNFHQLFFALLTHNKLKSKPEIVGYKSKKEIGLVIKNILEKYRKE